MMQSRLLIGLGVFVLVALGSIGYVLLAGRQVSTSTDVSTSPISTTLDTEVLPSAQPSPRSNSKGEIREIVVSGNEYSFTPGSLSLKEGEQVRIVFRNNGRLPHNLAIDELDVVSDTIPGGQETTVEFTAEKTGSFTMYCGVGNHRALGMEGAVEVK